MQSVVPAKANTSFQSLFRCRIDLGFNIIAPYMDFLHLNCCIAECNRPILHMFTDQKQELQASVIKIYMYMQIILPCINVCTELPAENRFRLD